MATVSERLRRASGVVMTWASSRMRYWSRHAARGPRVRYSTAVSTLAQNVAASLSSSSSVSHERSHSSIVEIQLDSKAVFPEPARPLTTVSRVVAAAVTHDSSPGRATYTAGGGGVVNFEARCVIDLATGIGVTLKAESPTL